MRSQTAIQKLLFSKLAEQQAKNPAYSLRAFARKLGVSPSTASMVMNGTRAVSVKLARQLCDALMLDPMDQAQILGEFPDRSHYKHQLDAQGEVLPHHLQLKADEFHLMSEWYYFGILSLMKTRGFRNDADWIARRLGISVREAGTAIDRMKRLGILSESAEGKLTRSAPQYRTTDDVADVSIRKSHFQTLELARRSLERDEVESRDFTYLTLPMNPKHLPEAKRKIRQLERELDDYLESLGGELTEVYRMAVQFFPLTQPASKKTKESPV